MTSFSRKAASPALRQHVVSRPGASARAVDVLMVSLFLAIAAAFAFRGAPPGFRHDWLWPQDRHVLERWFVEFGLSCWNPHGLGSGSQAPSFNWVLGFFAALATLGVSAASVLFVSFASLFIVSALGIGYLIVDALEVPVDRHIARLLGITYALSPVCFQKAVAGHLFWLVAYAALPWFIAFVWQGCRRDAGVAPFFWAALVYAISSAQIQFLAFDACFMLAIAAAHGFRREIWFGVAFVLAVGALQNGNAILAPFESSGNFRLGGLHGTRAWEIDMSTPLPDLAILGGYVGYDRAGLPSGLWWIPRAGVVGLIVLALVGVVRTRGRATIVFSIVGVLALLFASGWYGPFASLFDAALQRSVYFTLFRELYHIMGLYILALIVLAAFGCAALPRFAATVLASIALLAVAPYVTGGLNRLVPSVPRVAGENETGFSTKPLRVALPFPEPLTEPGQNSGGSDPARLDDDVASTLNAPPFMNWLLGSNVGASEQRRLFSDIGIADVAVRNDRVSFVEGTFEPGVGATFADFEARQRAMRRRFASPLALNRFRSIVQLEQSPERDPLQYVLADRELPPGRDVGFESSLENNDIKTNWVALRLWSWNVPEFANVMSDGVVTRSGAPLRLPLQARPGDTMYVLGAGRTFLLNGVTGTASPAVAGAYRWWRWPINSVDEYAGLRCDGLCAVVRVRVSSGARWRATPRPPAANVHPAAANMQVEMKWPWSVQGTLPPGRGGTLVFGRAFSPGWHLLVAGTDLGPSRRTDGYFNGWNVTDGSSRRTMRIEFEPQRRASAVVIASVIVELLVIVALIARRVRRASAW